jgi:2-polyprenyl-6-methoxyphenol hydroxylase-like FAD-dependent oxidoreductase
MTHVLISGAGIAGPTLAYWLDHYGISSTIIEKSPTLRTDGYLIDFWGAGFDIAGRMGLLPEILREGYNVQEVRVVNTFGKRIAGFPAQAFARAAQGRYTSIPRGNLAALIFRKIESKVEVIFGDSIQHIDQNEKKVQVSFESGVTREFDLVIGADGLHSRVRELVFGPQSKFEKYLGYKVAAFEVDSYRPRDELVYLMYTTIGQQVDRFALRGDRTMFLFIFADPADDSNEWRDLRAQKDLLKKRFANNGWECSRIIELLENCKELYFDRISQIQMNPPEHDSWTQGRVSLVGDAAFCVSLLAGQGSALAMIAAYILAGEIHQARGDHALAFARYQQRFGTFVLNKQKAALGFAGTFAPKSKIEMFLRNQVMNLMRIPWVTNFIVRKGLADKISLPDYDRITS